MLKFNNEYDELENVLNSCSEKITKATSNVIEIDKVVKVVEPVVVEDVTLLEQLDDVDNMEVIPCTSYEIALNQAKGVTKNGKTTIDQRLVGKAMLKEYQFIKNDRFFYKYDDNLGIWKSTSTGEINSIVTKDLDKYCNYWSDSTTRGITSFISNTVHGNIEGDTFDKVFNKNIYSIVFKNGTLDLRTGEFEPIFYTYDYNTVRIPHNYNAEASRPINTINFLSMITDKTEEIDFIFQWMGYLMVKGYPIQKMLFLNGDGGNGKSTLIKLMTSVVGEDNTSAVSMKSLIDNRFQSALLYNKLFNTVADIGSDFFDDSSILKALTGDDVITIERKGENGFSYKNFAKMTYSCNRLPKFKDTSGGLERRILVLDLNQDFTSIVKNSGIHINDILNDTEEMERVVAYSVKKFMEVIENNHNFTESESMLKAKSDWLSDDPIVDFMSEVFEYTGKKEDSIQMADFMKNYKSYCSERGYKAMSQKNVIENIKTNNELVSNDIKVVRDGNKGTKYKIVGVKPIVDEWIETIQGL